MRKRVSVGRCDGKPLTAPVSGLGRAVKMRYFASIDEAEAFIRQVARHDRAGVAAGDYFIDAPMQLLNGKRTAKVRMGCVPSGAADQFS